MAQFSFNWRFALSRAATRHSASRSLSIRNPIAFRKFQDGGPSLLSWSDALPCCLKRRELRDTIFLIQGVIADRLQRSSLSIFFIPQKWPCHYVRRFVERLKG